MILDGSHILTEAECVCRKEIDGKRVARLARRLSSPQPAERLFDHRVVAADRGVDADVWRHADPFEVDSVGRLRAPARQHHLDPIAKIQRLRVARASLRRQSDQPSVYGVDSRGAHQLVARALLD